MKISFTILFILIKTALLCQTFLRPHDSLIKAHHIKKIFVYTIDSTKKERNRKKQIPQNQYIYQFDSTGNIELEERFWGYKGWRGNSWTSVEKETRKYFYENNRLKSRTVTRPYDLDTSTYTYDRRNRLLKVESNSYYLEKTGYVLISKRIIQYEYPRKTITVVREEEYYSRYTFPDKQRIFYDTLLYNRKKQLLQDMSARTGQKTSYQYNSQNQLISKLYVTKRQDTIIWTNENKFIYKDNRLIHEEEKLTSEKNSENNRTHFFEYIYDEKGLLQITNRPQFAFPFNTLFYRYEYY